MLSLRAYYYCYHHPIPPPQHVGPFSSHGLPVSGVPRQQSLYDMGIAAPRPTLNLEGQGISLSGTSLKT